jgi:hypothetical protein
MKNMVSQFQNAFGVKIDFRTSGLKPACSSKSGVAILKSDILESPPVLKKRHGIQNPFLMVRILYRSLLLCILVFSFFSCASIPQDTETYVPEGWTAPKAPSPKELVPEWESYSRDIEYFAGQTSSPKLELWALKVDLTHPDIEIVINEPGWKKGYIYSSTVSHFVETRGLVAGINANPFSPVSNTEEEARAIIGLAISNGVEISEPDNRYDALLIYDDSLGAIVSQD